MAGKTAGISSPNIKIGAIKAANALARRDPIDIKTTSSFLLIDLKLFNTSFTAKLDYASSVER
jgi:hypothetical protein